MSDVFSEMCEPSEERPGKDGLVKRAGMMWTRAPAVNSLELAICAARVCDASLQHDIDFVETEIEGEWSAPRAPATPEDHRLTQARSALASLYLEHESIARSLGPENATTYARYKAICESEGLTPLLFPEYR